MASVNQIPVTDLNTQSSSVIEGAGMFNGVQKDQRGTPPIRLDPVQTHRLRLMFLTSSYLRLANEEMKNILFTHPFDVFLGTSKENVLKQTFKDSIISEIWLPALRKIHDWLIQFGIAPYTIRPMVLPSVSNQFDIGAFKKALSMQQKNGKDAKKNNEKSMETEKEEEEEEEKRDGDEKKEKKTPSIMMPSEKTTANTKKTTPNSIPMAYTTRGEELHYVIDVPDYDSGFVSTYVDHNSKQQFLWTWYPSAVPQSFDNRDGYTDTRIKFIVKDPPTIKGVYTCPLRTGIKKWLNINSREKMDDLSMRGRLNPVIFVEKQEPNTAKNPSVIDEMSINYSSAMNANNLARGQGIGGMPPGIDPATGEMILGYGQRLKYDTTRIDGMTDVGLNTYADGYGAPRRNEGPDYATLVSTLEFNRRGVGGLGFGSNNTPFNFGGINDDELTTNLGGLMNTFGSDPILTNPMNGVGYRVKKMEEGEKIVETKGNELDPYINTTSIEQQEQILEEKLCFLAGYPATFITGRSGTGKKGGGGGGKSSKGSGSSNFSGGGVSNAVVTGSDNDSSRSFLVGRVRHHKFYYQRQITKLFLKCYAESFVKSKVKLLKQLDESYWFLLEQVYAIKVELPTDPPPMDTSSLLNGFASGYVTPEEVIRNARLNQGLSLDVLDDPEFMARAIKKLENKYDPEAQLKLQQKYAPKVEGGGGGSENAADAGKGKKRKAEGEAKKKKDDQKKTKKQ